MTMFNLMVVYTEAFKIDIVFQFKLVIQDIYLASRLLTYNNKPELSVWYAGMLTSTQ